VLALAMLLPETLIFSEAAFKPERAVENENAMFVLLRKCSAI
jgi:hypothetical protein